MNATELATLVKQTREAQRNYFKFRTGDYLEQSKRLEKKLDAACEEILKPGLFDGKPRK